MGKFFYKRGGNKSQKTNRTWTCKRNVSDSIHGESASFQLSTGIAANRKWCALCAIAVTSLSMLCSSCSPVIWSSRYSAWGSPWMRQGLFPICIVCAVTAASSRKNFDKPSIATEKSFCNSKGVHSRSKQCLRIYKDHFALQNACWEIPNPWTTSDGCRLRVFCKTLF